MEIRWKLHCQVVASHVPTHLGMSVAGVVEEKEELKSLLKWGNSPFI